MASKRDCDEEIVVQFRGKEYRVPIHWRSDADVNRRLGVKGGTGRGVNGYVDGTSGHVWVSHEAGRRKVLDHELEHVFADIRLKIWEGD